MRHAAWTLASLGLALMAAALAGCTKIPPPTPLTELNPQQLDGHDVFDMHCANCHNERNNKPLNGPSLMGLFKKQYLPSGAPANDDRVMSAVVFGYGVMPAIGNTMTPEERQDLLAYLHTL